MKVKNIIQRVMEPIVVKVSEKAVNSTCLGPAYDVKEPAALKKLKK